MRKPGKRMASVIASIAAVCVMTGGIGYQAAVSGAQTDSTESSVKDQNTDQQESTDGSFSEEGTTQIGTVSQMPEFTVNAVTMTVEEVYASSGDTVSNGRHSKRRDYRGQRFGYREHKEHWKHGRLFGFCGGHQIPRR